MNRGFSLAALMLLANTGCAAAQMAQPQASSPAVDTGSVASGGMGSTTSPSPFAAGHAASRWGQNGESFGITGKSAWKSDEQGFGSSGAAWGAGKDSFRSGRVQPGGIWLDAGAASAFESQMTPAANTAATPPNASPLSRTAVSPNGPSESAASTHPLPRTGLAMSSVRSPASQARPASSSGFNRGLAGRSLSYGSRGSASARSSPWSGPAQSQQNRTRNLRESINKQVGLNLACRPAAPHSGGLGGIGDRSTTGAGAGSGTGQKPGLPPLNIHPGLSNSGVPNSGPALGGAQNGSGPK